MPKRTSTMSSLNLTITASQCPPPATAQTLTLAEGMYRSPKRSFKDGGKSSKYGKSAALDIRRSSSGCTRIPLPNRRSPSPSLSPFGFLADDNDDTSSARKRLRSFQHTSSYVSKPPSMSRSITPVIYGGRSETPMSASNRINENSTAASPLPLPPLAPRLPTARVLFGQAPTIAEITDFFRQVENQLIEGFEGSRRLGTPQLESVLNPELSGSISTSIK